MSQTDKLDRGAVPKFGGAARRLEMYLERSIEESEFGAEDRSSSDAMVLLQAELVNGRADIRAAAEEIRHLRAANIRQAEIIAELRRTVESLKEDLGRAEADRALLDQSLRDALIHSVPDWQRATSSVADDDVVDLLSERLARSTQQLVFSKSENERLTAEIAASALAGTDKDWAISDLRAQLAASDLKIDSLTDKLEGSVRQQLNINLELAAEKKQREAIEVEMGARLTSVYRSTSWRVTKPLRFASRTMMRLGISRYKRPTQA